MIIIVVIVAVVTNIVDKYYHYIVTAIIVIIISNWYEYGCLLLYPTFILFFIFPIISIKKWIELVYFWKIIKKIILNSENKR